MCGEVSTVKDDDDKFWKELFMHALPKRFRRESSMVSGVCLWTVPASIPFTRCSSPLFAIRQLVGDKCPVDFDIMSSWVCLTYG